MKVEITHLETSLVGRDPAYLMAAKLPEGTMQFLVAGDHILDPTSGEDVEAQIDAMLAHELFKAAVSFASIVEQEQGFSVDGAQYLVLEEDIVYPFDQLTSARISPELWGELMYRFKMGNACDA